MRKKVWTMTTVGPLTASADLRAEDPLAGQLGRRQLRDPSPVRPGAQPAPRRRVEPADQVPAGPAPADRAAVPVDRDLPVAVGPPQPAPPRQEGIDPGQVPLPSLPRRLIGAPRDAERRERLDPRPAADRRVLLPLDAARP